jgi:hypothetical protein
MIEKGVFLSGGDAIQAHHEHFDLSICADDGAEGTAHSLVETVQRAGIERNDSAKLRGR